MRQSIRLSETNFFHIFFSRLEQILSQKIPLEKQGAERFEESDPGEDYRKTIFQIHLDHCRRELMAALTVQHKIYTRSI